MTLWLQITPDKYEHPVAIADTAGELARMIGVKPNNIHSAMSQARKKGCWCKYIKVEIEEDDSSDETDK